MLWIGIKGLQKARGLQPALGPARARLWAGQATGLNLGPTL